MFSSSWTGRNNILVFVTKSVIIILCGAVHVTQEESSLCTGAFGVTSYWKLVYFSGPIPRCRDGFQTESSVLSEHEQEDKYLGTNCFPVVLTTSSSTDVTTCKPTKLCFTLCSYCSEFHEKVSVIVYISKQQFICGKWDLLHPFWARRKILHAELGGRLLS